MISISYVEGSDPILMESDPYLLCENTILTLSDEIDMIMHEFMIESKTNELVSGYLGVNLITEVSKDNPFVKIGDKIKSIINAVIKYIEEIIDKIKSASFVNKSDLAKLDSLCKANPDMKDSIIYKFESGELNVSDAKSLADLERSYEELMRACRKADADPNTIKGKWEIAKAKFEKAPLSDIKTVLGIGSAAISLALAIKGFSSSWKGHALDEAKRSKEYLSMMNKALEEAKDDGVDVYNMGTLSLQKTLTSYMAGVHKTRISKIDKAISAISNALRSVANKSSIKAAENVADKIDDASKKKATEFIGDAFMASQRKAQKSNRNGSYETRKMITELLDETNDKKGGNK